MTQEEKDLVLKDIGARLYYGVKISVPVIEKNMIFTVVGISESWLRVKNDRGSIFNVNTALEFKPYYRPISSMTEEEIIEFNNIPSTKNYTIIENDLPWDVAHYKQIDWLNKKMFDYRGLIQSASALEAPEGMYEEKEKITMATIKHCVEMDKVEKIKSEIKRRKSLEDEEKDNIYYFARSDAYAELLNFIDSLEEEPDWIYNHTSNNPQITIGTKIRSKANPDVILSIISDDCHGDKFECSNGSVLSLEQIEKYYDLYIEENNGTIVIN